MTKKASKTVYPTHRSKLRLIPKFFVVNWPIFALLFISLLLCYLNFDSGTFLTGWDNLHPEFNPGLNLQRAFFSVWQEYQSTGLLAGMAHAADLPRTLLIYLLSLPNTIPLNYFRYFSTFLPLVLGPIGVYFLLHQIAFRKDLDAKTSEIASFLGSLFYLLNLGSLQTFFTPFESFVYFYGALPWLLYLVANYQQRPKTRTLIILLLTTLFFTTAFYVETIFICLFLCLISYFIDAIWTSNNKISSLKKLASSFSVIITANLFWLLPVIFFVITNGHVGEAAKINKVASPETFYRNLEFGNFTDLLKLKGFWFQFLDLGINNKFDLLLSPWINHLNSPLIQALGIIFPIFFLIGVYYAFQKKFPLSKTFGFILGICIFFLLGGGLLINNHLPFVGELFRSPFTKFSVPFSLAYSYFFAIGIIFLLDIFAFLDTRLTYNLTLFSVIIALLIYMAPAFSGNFISKSMRLNIPAEYFELFKYLDTQPKDQRIANFPQHTFWGWNYYSWRYRGSGFLWYGIKQPILDRAFDVWEKTSQNYYEELSTALFSQNQKDFDTIVNKYNVTYLLIDKSIIVPDTKADTGLDYLESILKDNPQYSLEKSFGDNIFLYKNLPREASAKWGSQNFLSLSSPSTIYNLRSTILSFPLRPNQSWYSKANFLNTNLSLPSTIYHLPSTILSIPSLSDSENLLPYKIEYRKSSTSLFIRFTPITPVFFLNQKQIDLETKPQTVQVPVSSTTKKFILNINSQYFPFELPPEIDNFQNYYPITENYLPTQKIFNFGLFNGIPNDQFPLINSLANALSTQCYYKPKNSSADRKIEKILSPRSITLLGTDVVACLSTKLPNINNNQLLSVSFTYYSPTMTTANVNLTDEDFGTTNQSQPLDPSNTPKRAQLFIGSSIKNKQLNLILEASETKSIQEITYKDVYLTTHDPIFETTVSLNKIPKKSISLTKKENSLQISLPNTKTQFDIGQIASSNALFPEDRNCDQFNKGETVKQINSDHILYQSRNAIECDFLNLRHFDHSLNYLIGIDAQNNRGLTLTTCLENHATRRCDIYERLIDAKSTQYLLQPIANPKESPGYTLHLFNQSLGSRITENRLNTITIRPFPLTFLKSITINPSPSIADSATARADFADSLPAISSSHPAEFLYTATLTPADSATAHADNAELSLYQTSSPYWKAFILPENYKNLNPWQLTLKILLNYKSLPQLEKINNTDWFNSWSLPSTIYDLPAGLPAGGGQAGLPSTISIIYIPQYLEFLGFAILILSSTLLLIFSLTKQLRPKVK